MMQQMRISSGICWDTVCPLVTVTCNVFRLLYHHHNLRCQEKYVNDYKTNTSQSQIVSVHCI
jgi:hypothetical protein